MTSYCNNDGSKKPNPLDDPTPTTPAPPIKGDEREAHLRQLAAWHRAEAEKERKALEAGATKSSQQRIDAHLRFAGDLDQRADAVPTSLGMFGHHPDAAIDYDIEVDALIGLAYERLTMGGQPELEARIQRAMAFRTISTPGELRWLNQTFCGAREIYAVKPGWVEWPEEALAALRHPTDTADAGDVERIARIVSLAKGPPEPGQDSVGAWWWDARHDRARADHFEGESREEDRVHARQMLPLLRAALTPSPEARETK